MSVLHSSKHIHTEFVDILESLLVTMTDRQAAYWLHYANGKLGQRPPIELIAEGRTVAVSNLIKSFVPTKKVSNGNEQESAASGC